MTCWTIERRLPAYLENGVSDTERHSIGAHLDRCLSCTGKVQSQRQMRAAVRSLPRLAPPPDLAMRLRILASKERTLDRSLKARFRNWRDCTRVQIDNLMQPFALPAVGGIGAAVLLFAALLPTFALSQASLASLEDVPLCELSPLSTDPILKSVAPIGFQYGDAEVDLRIDNKGRIVNYSIISGAGLGVGPAAKSEKDSLRRSIENNLLFTTFTPATAHGKPTSGSLRLSFRSSRIDVKG